jgi:hypothetical protein
MGNEHSPEPWKIETVGPDRRVHVSAIYDAEQQYVLTPKPGDWTMRVGDARRIVACVNILKGISTERLEEMLEKGGCFGLSVFPNDPKYQAYPGLPKTVII